MNVMIKKERERTKRNEKKTQKSPWFFTFLCFTMKKNKPGYTLTHVSGENVERKKKRTSIKETKKSINKKKKKLYFFSLP